MGADHLGCDVNGRWPIYAFLWAKSEAEALLKQREEEEMRSGWRAAMTRWAVWRSEIWGAE
jgi:hypothetical protein